MITIVTFHPPETIDNSLYSLYKLFNIFCVERDNFSQLSEIFRSNFTLT